MFKIVSRHVELMGQFEIQNVFVFFKENLQHALIDIEVETVLHHFHGFHEVGLQRLVLVLVKLRLIQLKRNCQLCFIFGHVDS
jgi:hypothetical protein|tara:strand:- start:278 stop:526 length:249 start_codon:yes stop_codon:yes gene_type:complete